MHVIATAGHVDHGKSTLIRALTGMEPDRLSEERRRGLTIDLGYAWTTLSGGEILAFVDVPGHQRFITNMLAGVGPVPSVLFVVAADAGWRAQSGEHLEALDALGVRNGALALTRTDIGDAELAEQEAREHLAGTALEGIEAVAVSAITGAGLDELRGALTRMIARLPEHVGGRTRMWIDRVFTLRGAGTIVTGTLASGSVNLDAPLQLHPSGELVRIRRIQSLGNEVERADAVARVALNLRGVKQSQIHRGDALTAPDEWLDAAVLDVRLSREAQLPASLTLHVGSAAVPVRTRMLGEDSARLALARPVPTIVGERCLLRDPGSRRVLAATVLDPIPPKLTRRGDAARRATTLARLPPDPDLGEEVRRRGAVRRHDLYLIGVPGALETAPPGVVSAGEWLIDAERWTVWLRTLAGAVEAWGAQHPLRPGMPRQALMVALGAPDLSIVDACIRASDGIVADGDGVHRRGQRLQLPGETERALHELLRRLDANPFDALAARELVGAGLNDRVLSVAVQERRLTRVAEGIYLRHDAFEEAARRLARIDQPFTIAQAREALGTTRRVAVPLLERLDQQRRTRRIDAQLREVAATRRDRPGVAPAVS